MTSVIDRVRGQSEKERQPFIVDVFVRAYRSLNDFDEAYVGPFTWDIKRLAASLTLLGYLGQAMAKIHCVSEEDGDRTLVPFSTDQAISDAVSGREDDFVQERAFGQGYGSVVRGDYELFVDAFRNRMFPGL
jgi:uncharacterized protein (DUF2252 family)